MYSAVGTCRPSEAASPPGHGNLPEDLRRDAIEDLREALARKSAVAAQPDHGVGWIGLECDQVCNRDRQLLRPAG